MKPYVKPDLYYENFQLSQNVAACSWNLNSADKVICSATSEDVEGVQLFSQYGICNLTGNPPDFGYCETNGSADFNLFRS